MSEEQVTMEAEETNGQETNGTAEAAEEKEPARVFSLPDKGMCYM